MVSVQDKEEVKFFLDELNENLDYLDDAIINLEENPNDMETIEEIFRVAHTIKGSAGFLDLKNLVALGHAMENVFQEFKDGKIQVNTEVINTVLECKDAIGEIGRKLGHGEDTSSINTQGLIDKINRFLSKAAETKPKAPKTEAPPTAEAGESLNAKDYLKGCDLIRVWISGEEPAPAIRAFLVQKNISEAAEIIKQSPTEEEMDSEDFRFPDDRQLKFWVDTDIIHDELAAAARVDLIEKVVVVPESTLKSIAESSASGPKEGAGPKEDIELSETVRIPVQSLDVMLNLVGELVIANSGFSQIQERLRDMAGLDELYRHVRDRTKDLIRISSDIQDLVMKSRLVPISQVFNRFKRFVRDYSSRSRKKISLVMTGENTEIDKKIIDEMIKPLTHLVRNSLDHGIESPEERRQAGKNPVGTLHLLASQEGNYINVVIEDDGRGLDYNRIVQKALENEIITSTEAQELNEEEVKRLIFHPGFSTKDEVDEMSGRGVGMDVVKNSVEELNGTIILETEQNRGTKLTIKLPLTLAILNALIVKVGNDRFCIPMSSIIETQKVPQKNFLSVENNEMVRLRDSLIPIIRLDKIFPPELLEGESGESTEELPPENEGDDEETQRRKSDVAAELALTEELPVIVVDYHDSQVAILVDQFVNRQEMVIKSLSEHYRAIEGISGASILGDGSIILIIDVHGIIQLHQKKRSRYQDYTGGFGQKEMTLPSLADTKKAQAKAAPAETKPEAEVPKTASAVTLSDLSSMTPEQFEMLEDADIAPVRPEERTKAEEETTLEEEYPISFEDVAAPPPLDEGLPEDYDLIREDLLDDALAEDILEQVDEMEVLGEKIGAATDFILPSLTQEKPEPKEEPEPVAPEEIAEEEVPFEDTSIAQEEIEEIEEEHEEKEEEFESEEETENETPEEGLSEFEKMKQMIEISDQVYPDQNLALSHFDKSSFDFSKLNNILDGRDEENLKTWLKEANKKAINGIISLTGQENIRPGKIRAKKFSIRKVMDHLEELKMLHQEIVALKLPILPLSGMIYLIFTQENADAVCRKLFETAQIPAPDEMDYEPLLEVTNILGSAYTNTLTQITDIPIEPGLPEIIENREEVKKSLQESLAQQKHRILFVENQFLWDKKSVLADIILMIPQFND